MAEQRKVVTVLFADVVGSTAMAEQSDPEVVRATMARYFERIVEISQSYGGTVEKFAGDAAMVVFGVPVVHDDDAERAVRDITAVSEVNEHLGVIRHAQGDYSEAETALRKSLRVVAGTEYYWTRMSAAVALAIFLAKQGQLDEAKALSDEYGALVDRWGWHLYASQISEIRRLIAADQPAT